MIHCPRACLEFPHASDFFAFFFFFNFEFLHFCRGNEKWLKIVVKVIFHIIQTFTKISQATYLFCRCELGEEIRIETAQYNRQRAEVCLVKNKHITTNDHSFSCPIISTDNSQCYFVL